MVVMVDRSQQMVTFKAIKFAIYEFIINNYSYFCVHSLFILVCSYDLNELIKKCVNKTEDYQRDKEHNIRACL